MNETLLTNDASQTHGRYALALTLAWCLQSYPMAERTILHAGLADLICVNALELGGESERSKAHQALLEAWLALNEQC